MRKSVKLFSMAVMSVLMSLCFFFAGSALIKAEAPASLVVLDGASVYVSNNANESGIKFDVEIQKTDYQKLVENNAGSDIYLGVDVIRATSGEVLGTYDVNTSGALRTSEENSNNYAYNFAIIYNEVSYIEGLISGGKIEDTDAAKANAINKMYTDELAVKPFYKVVPAEGDAIVEYGAIGDSRSMIHVANAEVVAGAQLPANFASTYIAEQIAGGVVEVDAIGRITGDFAAEIKTFTKDASAEVVAREDAVMAKELLAGLNINDEFNLYGFTADRKVYSYTAKYVGAAGMEAVAFEEEILVAKDTGKVFLNGTSIEGEVIADVYYNGASIFVDGAVDASALADVDMATAFEIEVLTNVNKYAVSNAKLYDKVWENTMESRRDMTYFFSSYDITKGLQADPVYGGIGIRKEAATLDGYYALAEDLVACNEVGTEPKDYTLRETFYSRGNEHANTFIGTFDGRGYALYNFGFYGNGGIFGLIGSNATIKNVAIINSLTYAGGAFPTGFDHVNLNILLYGRAGDVLSNVTISDVYLEWYQRAEREASSFAIYNLSQIITGDNEVTITNFIINKLHIYPDGSIAVDKGVDLTGAKDENNQSIPDGIPDPISTAVFGEWAPSRTKGANVTMTNAYIITRGRTYGGGGWHPEGFGLYTTPEDFENAASGLDLTTFENDNWVFNEKGAPVWKTTQTLPQVFDMEGNEVKSISYGVNGATDSVFFTARLWTSSGIKNAVITTNDAQNVIINGNSIEVKPGKYTATITVANEDGSVSKTFNVTVDTSIPEDFNEQVLYSKAANKVYLNRTSLEEDTILAVAEYDFSQVVTGTSISGLVIYTDNAKYNLTNVLVCEDAYANTHEDRVRFVNTFSSASKTITGYYALVENITFEHAEQNGRLDDTSEVFMNNTIYQKDNFNTFAGTFDGRGFAFTGLKVKIYHYAIFGNPTDGAVLKNFAINGITVYNVYNDYSRKHDFHGILFAAYTNVADEILMENIYVEYDVVGGGASTRNGALFANAGNVDFMAATTFRNVIVKATAYTAEGTLAANGDTSVAPIDATGNPGINTGIIDSTHIENSHIITNGCWTQGLAGNWFYDGKKWNSRKEIFGKYNNYEEFVADKANIGVETFLDPYWVINEDGVPEWKAFAKVPQIVDSEDKEVKEIIYDVEGATDSLFYSAGIWTVNGVQEAVVSTNNSDNVVINGNSIEVKPGKYTATITVASEDGSVSKTFNVTVDTSVSEDFNEQVLYSKATGKIILKGTSIESVEVQSIGEYDFSQVAGGSSISGLLIYTDVKKFNLTNVLVCDDAFANTHEDRVRFVNFFTYASKTITGYYALVENITFDHFTGANGAYDNSETFISNRDVDSAKNIYQATFDGRGYTMKDIGVADRTQGIFGDIGDGAVVKNIAFINVVSNATASDNGKTGDFWSFLFRSYTSASAKFTLENVYIENTLKAGDYRTDMGYKHTAIMAAPPQTSDYPIGSGTFTNVIINYMSYDANGNLTGTFDSKGNLTGGYTAANVSALTTSLWDYHGFGDDCHINNSHVITNGCWNGGLQGNWYHATSSRYNSRGECFGEFGSYQSFVNGKDKIGVATFSDKYWTINEDGVPVWTTATQIPQILDAEGEKVDEIVYEVEGATESLFYTAGIWTAEGVLDATVSCDNENVVISGNSIEVKPGKYTATIVVANADGSISKEFEVVVNTNLPEEMAEEVLLDKTTGQLFFQGTSLAGKSASIDTSIIDENQAVNTSFELGVVLVDGEKYNLTNVKMYDRVWENTRQSRQDFVDFFATGDNTSTDNRNPKDPVTLSGYYTIAEDITFSHYEDGSTGIHADKDTTVSEMFMHKANEVYNLFKGTFDGRGHVMSEVGFYTAFSIFGVAGDGATIKNVAINNVARYVGHKNIQHEQNGGGIFFRQPEALNTNVYWENVFVNLNYRITSGGSVLYYSTVGGLTWSTAEGKLTWVDGKATYNGVEFDSAKGGGLGINHINNFVVNIVATEGSTSSSCVTNKGGTFYNWNVEEELNNVIFITKGRIDRALSDIGSKGTTKHVKYADYDAFVAAKASHDFTTFNSTYWEVNADGVIVWKGLDYAKLPAVEPAE